jgi:hypothetical protein
MRRLGFGAHLPARWAQCRKVSGMAGYIHGRALWAAMAARAGFVTPTRGRMRAKPELNRDRKLRGINGLGIESMQRSSPCGHNAVAYLGAYHERP